MSSEISTKFQTGNGTDETPDRWAERLSRASRSESNLEQDLLCLPPVACHVSSASLIKKKRNFRAHGTHSAINFFEKFHASQFTAITIYIGQSVPATVVLLTPDCRINIDIPLRRPAKMPSGLCGRKTPKKSSY
jgi:hypothetical protein